MKTDIQLGSHEWLVARQQMVTGTDVACLFGVNQYKSFYQLWAEKKGIISVEDISDKFAVKRGIFMEDIIARKFQEKYGCELTKETFLYSNDNVGRSGASLDYTYKIGGEYGILEIKTTNKFSYQNSWGGGDIVPMHVQAQVYQQMACSGYDVAYVYVAVIDDNIAMNMLAIIEQHNITDDKLLYDMVSACILDLQEIKLNRNESTIDGINKKINEFWKLVDSDEVVHPDANEDSEIILTQLKQGGDGMLDKKDDNKLDVVIKRRERLSKLEGRIRKQKEDIDKQLKAMLVGYEGLETASYDVKITKSMIKERVVEASTRMTMRIKNKK